MPFRVSPPRWALRQWLIGDDANDELAAEVEESLRQPAPDVLAHRLASISRIDERASLRALQLPIVAISARHDGLVSARDTAELLAHAPGARHFELDGPHLLLQARPRQMAELLHAHSLR